MRHVDVTPINRCGSLDLSTGEYKSSRGVSGNVLLNAAAGGHLWLSVLTRGDEVMLLATRAPFKTNGAKATLLYDHYPTPIEGYRVGVRCRAIPRGLKILQTKFAREFGSSRVRFVRER